MCEVISLEYKYLDGVQAPEMGTANHGKTLSTFQILQSCTILTPQIQRGNNQQTITLVWHHPNYSKPYLYQEPFKPDLSKP